MQKNKRITLLMTAIVLSSALVAAASKEKEQDMSQVTNTTSYFSDVEKTDWFYEGVEYVFENNLMMGTGEISFSPNLATTRGMLVTILWRLEKKNISTKECYFTDVNSDMYYYEAIKWALAENLISGYDDNSFGPDDSISREQLVTILYRYMSYKNADISHATEDLSVYKDFDKIEPYAIQAFKWAIENKIITGISEKELSPKGNAVRCQVATLLKRICEEYHIVANITSEKPINADTDADVKPTNSNSFDSPSKNETIIGNSSSDASESSNNNEDIRNEYSEDKNVIIKANTTYGYPGEVVDFTVDLKNNPGILGIVLSLEYDESAMNLLEVENGEAVSDILTLTTSKMLNSGVRFVWDGLDLSSKDIKDGTLLTLKFEIFDDVTIGKRFPLKLSYNSGDIVNSDLNEINPQIIQAYIEIEETSDWEGGE